MGGIIYFIDDKDKNQLIEMREKSYDSEDVLQELLARYPNLLAGDQIDVDSPRRWLLISREFGVPDSDGAPGRWSLDHLFLDQDAIPTLVEVKRSSDTRIRREVVGQILDYAANAVVYWPMEKIISEFETRCNRDALDPEKVLSDFLGDEADSEKFWEHARTNLQAGKIRLIFIADEIPVELRRVAEFLNRQMEQTEVLAIEVKQFVGEGVKTLVPRMVVQTRDTATSIKREYQQWDEPRFFKELELRRGLGETKVARAIFDWANSKSIPIWWGKGRIDGSFIPGFKYYKTTYYPVAVWTNGSIGIQFYQMAARPIFNEDQKRIELLNKLNSIPGINFDQNAFSRYPSFGMVSLQNEAALKQFLDILDWFIEQLKNGK